VIATFRGFAVREAAECGDDVSMDSRADELVEGPRGRRMLYELASLADDDLSSFAWDVERSFDNSGSAVFVSWGPASDEHERRPERAEEVGEVAARIAGRSGHDVVDEERIVVALADSVGWARAWQEPDGTDMMLEDPAFVSALRPLAERVARMPEVEWWWHPVTQHQTVTRFSYADPETRVQQQPPVPEPSGTAAQLARWRQESRETEQQFVDHAANYPGTPLSGDWWALAQYTGVWSTPSLGAHGPAALHFVEDGGGERLARVWDGRPRDGARVLEITGPDDWADLCRRHPFDVTESRRHVWGLATGRQGRWVIPDWPAVAVEWDAVHLTVAGYLRTAERAVPVDGETATVLAGWDPAATVWFGEAIELDATFTEWRRDDEAWIRVAGRS
jgi:hypothetical protein